MMKMMKNLTQKPSAETLLHHIPPARGRGMLVAAVFDEIGTNFSLASFVIEIDFNVIERLRTQYYLHLSSQMC